MSSVFWEYLHSLKTDENHVEEYVVAVVVGEDGRHHLEWVVSLLGFDV